MSKNKTYVRFWFYFSFASLGGFVGTSFVHNGFWITLLQGVLFMFIAYCCCRVFKNE